MPKYLIRARIVIDGVAEKHDVIGAIFGQTEGLLGEEFDLRKLQDRGRIGRIQVELRSQGNKTVGEILLPSNLDRVETALIAAMIESVDKVGPYNARITVEEIIDVRLEKVKRIVERAKQILAEWSKRKELDPKEVLQEISRVLEQPQIIKYGPEQLPAGPDVDKSDTIIIVEGRADVINLLRYGITNTIALGGARAEIPETIKKLARSKKVIAFLDGDHAGDLILKELLRTIKVDYIARAPPGKEVEDLTGREIEEALKKAVPVKTYIENIMRQRREKTMGRQTQQRAQQARKMPISEEKAEKSSAAPITVPAKPAPPVREVTEVKIIPVTVIEDIKSLIGTLEAIIYDSQWNKLKRIPVRNLVDELRSYNSGDINAVVFDGIITQRLLNVAAEKKIPIIIGAKLGNIRYKPEEVLILTFNNLL